MCESPRCWGSSSFGRDWISRVARTIELGTLREVFLHPPGTGPETPRSVSAVPPSCWRTVAAVAAAKMAAATNNSGDARCVRPRGRRELRSERRKGIPRPIQLAGLMITKIKICGITNVADALAAVDAGADALGFVFYEASPRFVPQKVVAEIVRALPPFVAKVGVFVNATADAINRVVDECGLDTLQFHGDEPPEFCRRFRIKTIKAFRIRDARSLERMAPYHSEAWLLDTFVAGKLGGTGEQFNWDLAREAVGRNPRVILAGGLTPDNVAQAVRQVRPFAVDVSSGVELSPGKKDHAKIRAFITAVRSVEGTGDATVA